MVLNIFGNAVDFVFGLMYFYLRIGSWDGINLSIHFLLFKNGSFSDVDGKFSFAIAYVGRNDFLFELIFFDHDFKVDVNIFARGHVVGFLLLFLFFGLLHLDPSLFSFLLNFLDGLHWAVVVYYSLCNLNKKKFICIYFFYMIVCIKWSANCKF